MIDSVQLTYAEVKISTWVGKQRHAYALSTHRDAGEGPSARDKSPDNHIRGARSEYAASIVLNVYWRPTIGEIGAPDVGGLFQVRSTVRPDGRLIIKPKDADDQPFVLMLAQSDTFFSFRGWFYAGDAKQTTLRHYPDTDPAYYVAQGALRGIGELQMVIREATNANA